MRRPVLFAAIGLATLLIAAGTFGVTKLGTANNVPSSVEGLTSTSTAAAPTTTSLATATTSVEEVVADETMLNAPVDVAGPTEGPSYAEALIAVSDFVTSFDEAQANLDVDFLVQTLDPATQTAFGEEACLDYLTETVGSVSEVELMRMGKSISYVYNTPAGSVVIPNAWPVELAVTVQGARQILFGHFIYDGDQVTWLTNCSL